MKIESYKKKTLMEENFPLFKQLLAKGYSEEDVFESDYLTLLSKSFERGPFLRLCYLAGRVLRNSDCKKDFEFALKLAYSLIKTGERYLKENDDYDIESATAKLYERLGFILFSDDVYDFIPDSTIQIKYNISEDNKLAKYYFERAVVLDPNLIDSYFALGLYYLRIKNYHKSFAYLSACPFMLCI